MEKKDPNCEGCNKQKNPLTLSRQQVGGFAQQGNLKGALGASFGLAVGSSVGSKVGNRLGGMPTSSLMNIIETPGTNGQKSSMNGSQKNQHLIKSVGLGNFSLNSTYESGLINAVSTSKNNSLNFLKRSDTGSSLLAASSLGIDIPNGDMLGASSNDSSMFKLLKFASFGLLIMCALLRGKRRGGPGGYNSRTEELLGLILSINIDLSLLARLKSIFDRLLGLKLNFSSFGITDLNISGILTNLCDWAENMAYGSPTLDSFREILPGSRTNKSLTNMLGNKFINEGTYDSYAKNDFGFDQQFKSIAGDIDALKCDACKLGQVDITLMQGSSPVAMLEFDPRSGLQRETGFVDNTLPTENIVSNDLGIDYKTETNDITFEGETLGAAGDVGEPGAEAPVGTPNITKNKSILNSVNEFADKSKQPINKKEVKKLNRISADSEIPSDNIIKDVKTNSSSPSNINEESSGVRYETDGGVSYSSEDTIKDTHQNDSGDLVTDTYTSNKEGKYTKTNTEVVAKKPFGGNPVESDATEVKSYHTGKTITKEQLKGTVLEDADLNAVALLADEDLENLKDTEKVNQTLQEAEDVWDKTFNSMVEETENLVLEEQSSGVIFGVQLPDTLNGNQIVINSERVLISSKTQEVGIFAKRKFFVTTDDEITMNAKERIVLKTDAHTSIESPTIHLGCYTTRNHPTLKGDCTVWWLQDLCDWLSSHVHNDPYITTGTPNQQGSLAALRARTPTLLSERIFISG